MPSIRIKAWTELNIKYLQQQSIPQAIPFQWSPESRPEEQMTEIISALLPYTDLDLLSLYWSFNIFKAVLSFFPDKIIILPFGVLLPACKVH